MTAAGVTSGASPASTGSTGVTGHSHGSSHTLTFSRLRANFTVDKELIGKQDPYVIFQSGHTKVQTKAIKGVGTGTAEWKESYTLEKFSPSSSSVVEVTVYNHNTLLPDSVIGSGTVDLSRQGESSLSGSGDPLTVNLVDKKGSNVGTLSFVTHGGGYTGSGARSGTGVGSGHTGTGHHHTGSGVASGVGAGAAGAGAGTVVGKGIGSDQHTAQKASDRAAQEGRKVTVEGNDGVGVGHPTHAGSGHHHTGSGHHHTGTGVGSGTGVTSDRGVTGAGVGTGHHTGHHHTGTGVTGVEAGRGAYGEKEGEVIDRKYYTGTEARPQDQALVEQYREHNPYAKDYETTVQHTGRERLVGSQIEALGTRERVIGQSHNVEAHPHDHIARNLPAAGAIPGVDKNTGALPDRPGGEGWVQTKPGPVCDTNTFSISGDRTVDKERVTDLREHREFEKEFEVKTRLVGERALNQGTDATATGAQGNARSGTNPISGSPRSAEILNRERVLVDEKNKNACEGHPDAAVGSGVGSGTTGAYGSGTSGYGSSGTGTGVGTGVGTGHHGTGHHHHTGTGVGGTGVGSGTGLGSGTGGSGYGSGTGTGQRSTAGEKAAGFIPGSEENRDKKQGYAPGQGPEQTAGNRGVGEKAASFIPGSEENREKKQGTAGTGAQRAI